MTNLNEALRVIENLQKQDFSTKVIATLSSMHESINALNFNKLKLIMKEKEYFEIKKKNRKINNILKTLLADDFNKVKLIEQKLNDLKKLYWSYESL